MTVHERIFFDRLTGLIGHGFYIFPQIHLSSLLLNKTKGKYYRAAFQRINHLSVDFALVSKKDFTTYCVIELDDSSHDTAERRKRYAKVEHMLKTSGVHLVRFRDIRKLNDDDIIARLRRS